MLTLCLKIVRGVQEFSMHLVCALKVAAHQCRKVLSAAKKAFASADLWASLTTDIGNEESSCASYAFEVLSLLQELTCLKGMRFCCSPLQKVIKAPLPLRSVSTHYTIHLKCLKLGQVDLETVELSLRVTAAAVASTRLIPAKQACDSDSRHRTYLNIAQISSLNNVDKNASTLANSSSNC